MRYTMDTTTQESGSQHVLGSYVLDAWWYPGGGTGAQIVAGLSGALTRDASTGSPMGAVSADGLDIQEVVAHARNMGRSNVGQLTLHERARILKELALYLKANRQSLDELSLATGATATDGTTDIDGGISTLLTFSSKGRRELPNAHVIEEGPVETFAKDGTFMGTHILQPLPGVAVQINAFNFPVWGMLEKFAPAFIAGLPVIVKPATPTAYLTVECVRLMIESGLLPAGALQLITGSARDLLDYLDYRDVVAFTGSATTARSLAGHPSVTQRGLRFQAETDSLNAAILGPDVGASSVVSSEAHPTFDAFIDAVWTEMVVKAGQKCTAIRRVFVPHGMTNHVVAALTQRLETRTVVGDPREDGTTMGPLASTDQAAEVRAALDTLIAAGGHVAYGNTDKPRATSAFMNPVILTFADPTTPELHDVEVFGPVVSIAEYASPQEAVDLAALGGGSLVATVCSNKEEFVAQVVAGIAGHHGRVHVLDAVDAQTSTGHGAPLPHLIHGGPGRAGGGEELGGVRAIKHHMSRTAVQGPPDMLTAITGVWHTGAATRLAGAPEFGGSGDNPHPFTLPLNDLRIGDGFASGLRQVTREDITAFANTTGDTFYAHTDDAAAEANPFFPGVVAHGYLLVSWAAGLFVEPSPGPVLANYGLENLRFITPVQAGDSIRVTIVAKRITPRATDNYGEVAWDAVINNQRGDVVVTYDVLTLVEKDNSTRINAR